MRRRRSVQDLTPLRRYRVVPRNPKLRPRPVLRAWFLLRLWRRQLKKEA